MISLYHSISIISFLNGIISVIIAGIVAYIAWRQHKTNQYRLNLDLYEKRFAVYLAVKDHFNSLLTDPKGSENEFHTYRLKTNGAMFLFEKDIFEYINMVEDKVNHFNQIQKNLEHPESRSKKANTKILENEKELLDWFGLEYDKIEERFRPYLDFSKIQAG